MSQKNAYFAIIMVIAMVAIAMAAKVAVNSADVVEDINETLEQGYMVPSAEGDNETGSPEPFWEDGVGCYVPVADATWETADMMAYSAVVDNAEYVVVPQSEKCSSRS